MPHRHKAVTVFCYSGSRKGEFLMQASRRRTHAGKAKAVAIAAVHRARSDFALLLSGAAFAVFLLFKLYK
jgi:hypothetical protein